MTRSNDTLTKSPNNQLLNSKPVKIDPRETTSHKIPSYLFVGSNGTCEVSEIIYKRVSANLDKTKDDKNPAWEKLKQISSNL